MERVAHQGAAQKQDREFDRVAERRPEGYCTPTYAQIAHKLLDQGYEPVPIAPKSKKVAAKSWTTLPIDEAQVDAWSAAFGDCGTGLRTGRLVAVDIDILDPEVAHDVAALAQRRLGDTLMRVGRWPKRLLAYRTATPFKKLSVPHVEILAEGQQFVAFGIHPDTQRPYDWPLGNTPLDVALEDLPLVKQSQIDAFLAGAAALTAHLADDRRPGPRREAAARLTDGPVRDTDGRVVDGRDGWLSTIAFHAVHDAIDASAAPDVPLLVEKVWNRFAGTTDLGRRQKDGRHSWSIADAARKVRDKLALLAAGRLPDRTKPAIAPADLGVLLPPDTARRALADTIKSALAEAMGWWSGDCIETAPVAGIRATVGLGKSAISRDLITEWQRQMAECGLPHRVLVVTPSHALAEEAATDWAAKATGSVAVLRGYEAHHPVSREPMCRDIELAKTALLEGLLVGKAVCYSSPTWQCPHYHGCHKQQNRREVAEASVVLAPYDVLFTGLGAGDDPFGLIVIDEGCWQRAERMVRGPAVEKLGRLDLSAGLRAGDPASSAEMADLADLNAKAGAALLRNGPGLVRATALKDAGLSANDCLLAADLGERCITEVKIYPGMKAKDRGRVTAVVKRNELARRMAMIWRSMAALMTGATRSTGVLRIEPPDPATDLHGLVLHDHQRLVPELSGLPILHLDATMRADLARTILPGLQVTSITADQPHMNLTLIAGRFGKSTLCASKDLASDEMQRRQNRLREVVDHVRWNARRVAPGRVLVVTYKSIEEAFAGIESVETAHFNAIAGLDQYRDIRLLLVVGRPLPSSDALEPLAASFFHSLTEGGYRPTQQAVHLRTGGHAVVRAVRHGDEQAELLRAAICDDELIQAIGRGRGVNRTAENLLEVQVMADVALPLIHDRLVAWETVVPDILQRMLMDGLASSSPKHSWQLHPSIFASEDQARKVFSRSAFKGHFPISNSYREMSLKSASYRLGGRGQSWETALWISGSADDARRRLERAIGELAEWESA